MYYFKLVGSASYTLRSPNTGRVYSMRKDELVGIQDERDVDIFRNNKVFQELDKDGKEMQSPTGRKSTKAPISYSKVKVVPNEPTKLVASLSHLKNILHPSTFQILEESLKGTVAKVDSNGSVVLPDSVKGVVRSANISETSDTEEVKIEDKTDKVKLTEILERKDPEEKPVIERKEFREFVPPTTEDPVKLSDLISKDEIQAPPLENKKKKPGRKSKDVLQESTDK